MLGEASGKPAADVPAEKTAAVSAAPAAQTDESVPEGGRIFITPRAKMRAEEMGIDYTMIRGTGEDGLIVERDSLAAKPAITPLAKKIAELSGVDVSGITGTGAHGKIVRDDIVAAARISPAAERCTTLMPFKGMRKVIAERMVESLRRGAGHSPHQRGRRGGQSARSVHEDGQEAVIQRYRVVRCGCALKDTHRNSVDGRRNCRQAFVDTGIAVAVENGLIVPVVRAPPHELEELSAAAALAEKAKTALGRTSTRRHAISTSACSGWILRGDYQQAESGIIAVGRIARSRLWMKRRDCRTPDDGTDADGHRVVDGAPAAVLARVKTYRAAYLLLWEHHEQALSGSCGGRQPGQLCGCDTSPSWASKQY